MGENRKICRNHGIKDGGKIMTIKDLTNNIDIQNTIHYCYYDYDKSERIEITEEMANDKEIKYLYCDDNEIYIEIDMDDLMEEITENSERKHLHVCEHCLFAIESREGNQATLTHYIDDVDNETESKCDWCEEYGFDTLYELV